MTDDNLSVGHLVVQGLSTRVTQRPQQVGHGRREGDETDEGQVAQGGEQAGEGEERVLYQDVLEQATRREAEPTSRMPSRSVRRTLIPRIRLPGVALQRVRKKKL